MNHILSTIPLSLTHLQQDIGYKQFKWQLKHSYGAMVHHDYYLFVSKKFSYLL